MSEQPIKVRVGRPLRARLIVEPEPQLCLKASGGVVVPEYEGSYEVTPSGEEQVLATEGKAMLADVTVHAAPLQTVSKTVSASGTESILPGEGYYGIGEFDLTVPEGRVSMNRPSLDNASGEVRSRATIAAGYVATGGTYTGSALTLDRQAGKAVTPSESAQTAVEQYRWTTGAVTVDAIPSDYVGSSIDRRSSDDLTETSGTVDVPAGYYAAEAHKSVQSGTVGTPTARKGEVYGHSVDITPSVTNQTGYITGGTIDGAYVTVTASELASGTKSITANGTEDVTGYASVDVNVQPTLQSKSRSYTPTESAQSETIAPDTGNYGLSSVSVSVGAIASDYVGSAIDRRDSTDLAASGDTVTVPAGYYAAAASKAVASGSATMPSSASGSGTIAGALGNTMNVIGSVTATPQVSAGYVSGGTSGSTSVAISVPVTTKNATTYNPQATDRTIAAGTYTIGTQTIKGAPLESATKSYTPSETAQSETIAPSGGNYGLASVDVSVGAIPSSYVGSAIDRRDSTDLTASGDTVTVPAGYYENAASKGIGAGSAVASATKGTVSNHSVDVTPKVTRTAGYVSAGSANGTAVTVTAAELVSGTKPITSNGTGIDVTEYAAVDVAVPSGSPTLQSKSKSYTPSETAQSETVSCDAGYDGLSSVDVSVGAISSSYVGTGITRRDSTDLGASGATVTAPAGYYESAATKTVASGSASPAASISGTSASVSTGTNTLTLSKTVSNTPQVSAGYVSAGTAGNSSVSLTASVTTKAAATYYAGTSDQTIAASQYLTGAQTIKAVTQTNLEAANIKSGTTISIGNGNGNIWSVTGTYTGGGGGSDHLTLLATKSLGTISTSSTSAADTGQTLDVTGFDGYDMLIAICHTSPHTNGRHVATVRLINFSATSNVNTKTSTSIATSTQHYKLSSSGTMSERSGTTPYGVYVNAATISTGTPRKCTLTIYQRYNSTSSGTINGSYTLDVYGVKLQDLF